MLLHWHSTTLSELNYMMTKMIM